MVVSLGVLSHVSESGCWRNCQPGNTNRYKQTKIPKKFLWPTEKERGKLARWRTSRHNWSTPAEHHEKDHNPITTPISKCWMDSPNLYSCPAVTRHLLHPFLLGYQTKLGGEQGLSSLRGVDKVVLQKHQGRPHGDPRLPPPPSLNKVSLSPHWVSWRRPTGLAAWMKTHATEPHRPIVPASASFVKLSYS